MDVLVISAVFFSIAVFTVFTFMVISNINQNRSLHSDHVSNDLDTRMSQSSMSDYSEQKLELFKKCLRGE